MAMSFLLQPLADLPSKYTCCGWFSFFWVDGGGGGWGGGGRGGGGGEWLGKELICLQLFVMILALILFGFAVSRCLEAEKE